MDARVSNTLVQLGAAAFELLLWRNAGQPGLIMLVRS
jgi:hypothetical protein